MDHEVANRRTDARFRHPWFDTVRTTLRPGCLVVLIDLSAGGALVQSPRPLRPGARVHVQFVADGRPISLVAHVLRCGVSSIDPVMGVAYRGGLKFDHRCDLFREDVLRDGLKWPEPEQ